MTGQNLKLSLMASAVLAASSTASADLIISEYVEGSSYEKAIELYNSGDVSINLADYQLVKFTNGSETSKSTLQLTGSLPAGATYVIAHNRASVELQDKAQLVNGSVINFNGDDPVALQNKAGDTLDLMGQFGKVKFGKDKTLARKAGSTPSAEYDAAQWDQLAKNAIEGLGKAPGGVVVPPTPVWECQGELTEVFDIQGSGDSSPLVPEGSFAGGQVTVQGIVTKRVESLYKGFFLQAEQGDGDEATSDGIFVFTGDAPAASIKEGSRICMQGQVREYFGQTQLSLTEANFQILEENAADIEAVHMEFDPSTALESQLEQYEGMLVSTTGSDLVVTRNFGFDFDSFRNNMVLSLSTPLYKPTQKFAALSPEAKQLAAENDKGQLFVETDAKPGDGEVPYFDEFNAETGYIRVGDNVENLEGVLAYSFGEYRLIPETAEQLDAADFVHDFSDREDQPDLSADHDLKVASFNVLNYFNSGVGGDSNPLGQNRGAGSNQADFEKQRTKIVSAMISIDADILGLMEIENNGFGEKSAIQDLVTHLNAELSEEDQYRFVRTADNSVIGTDAIAVGILYRPAKVSLAKGSELIEMPIQRAEYQALESGNEVTKSLFKGQRNTLVQEFTVKLDDGQTRPLTVAVNHFKSKGSQCFNDYAEYEWPVPLRGSRVDERNAGRVADFEEDLQGSCNEFRLSAAKVLGDYMRENKAGDVLLLGDYNAYGKEDPVRLLTDYDGTGRQLKTAPYTLIGDEPLTGVEGEVLTDGYDYVNLAELVHGTDAFSYTFSGELGSLDHAIGSGSITAKLAEVTDWHINSLENNLFEYSGRFSGSLEKSDNSFSSSDHDPVILTLDYSLSKAQRVELDDMDDARVILEMTDYRSDSFARFGIARPELARADIGQAGFLSAEEDKRYLAAYETLESSASVELNSVSTAWALVLERSFAKTDLLEMSSEELRRAKLDVSRSDVTRTAIALELAEELSLDDQWLAAAILDNPRASHQKVLINILGMDFDRRALRKQVNNIKSEMQPAVQHERWDIING
ncbi:nuclease [Endozoicomonas sp. OPT23]|uniref:ExeM/NucH family extracellular endonuclease n=1 Tax=Endozoicomonas sp. OPT23 TaxID=2072845 RepID=UPI00129A15DD|nr:ExeM/NucH family extracellular endonuclease [Endozoicomonas sp. OPT23]MRI32221.1 nuclease [Endozoicomonas sp. OPT23]